MSIGRTTPHGIRTIAATAVTHRTGPAHEAVESQLAAEAHVSQSVSRHRLKRVTERADDESSGYAGYKSRFLRILILCLINRRKVAVRRVDYVASIATNHSASSRGQVALGLFTLIAHGRFTADNRERPVPCQTQRLQWAHPDSTPNDPE